MSTSPSTLADLYPGLPGTATVSTPADHKQLMDLAVRFADLVVSAIPAGSISPGDYAGRTESAVREAATAGTFSEALSLAVESVAPGQRGALSADMQTTAVQLAAELADPQLFAAWAEMLGRDTVYVVAATMVTRRGRRAAKAGKKTDEGDPPLSATLDSLKGTPVVDVAPEGGLF